jgi:tRNA (guanine-N7-)-methyltransferase
MSDGTSESGNGMPVNPDEFIITRKRKKYKFAKFANSPVCFEYEQWDASYVPDVVEIGAGTGLFSVAQALGHPEGNFLAVDVKADRLQKGAYEAAEKDMGNIRFLRSRADLIGELLKPHSLDILWITFPDPFPRRHSAGRRLTHPKFLQVYGRLLKPGGALYFKTDALGLFQWSLEQLVAEGWKLEELSFDLHDSRLADWYKLQTTYEARFVQEGLKVNFVKAIPPKAS